MASIAESRLLASDRFLYRVPSWAWFVVTVILVTVKSGLYLGHNFRSEALSDESFRPEGWSLLLDPSLLAAIGLRITTRPLYELFSLGLSVAIFVVIAWLLRRNWGYTDGRWIFTLIALGPIGALLFRHFGRYDAYLVLGAAIVVLAAKSRLWVVILGAALMSLGNAGQAIATSLALLILTFTSLFHGYRKVALTATIVSLIWLVAATSIGDRYGVASQLDYLPELAGQSMGYFFTTFPLIAYSVYGVGWLCVVGAFLLVRKRSWVFLTGGFLFLPMTFMAITTDGTRVGVGVALLPLLAAAVVFVPRLRSALSNRGMPGAFTLLVILAVIAPNPWLGYGELRAPYEWGIAEVEFWWTVLTG